MGLAIMIPEKDDIISPNQIGTYCIQDGVGLISAKVRLCLWLM